MLNSLQRLIAPVLQPTATPGSMPAAECLALRQLLLLTQSEAATWLGGVSERSWQYWESGRRPIPHDVSKLLRKLAGQRRDSVEAAAAQIADGTFQIAVWYQTENDWRWRAMPKDVPWAWKLHNSVIAELAGRGLIALVGFDASDFSEWVKRSGRKPVRVVDEAGEHLAWAAECAATQGGSA